MIIIKQIKDFIKLPSFWIADESCKCKHCTTHDLYVWAVITECPCACHTMDGLCGHDSLCCCVPNGLKKNNPYKTLEKASVYRKILDDFGEY